MRRIICLRQKLGEVRFEDFRAGDQESQAARVTEKENKMSGGLIQIPMTIDRDSDVPLQVQLIRGIQNLITQGVIRPDMRLPASRTLGRQLGVSRNTVKIAYHSLISQGYLQSKGTNGTYVCNALPETQILTPDAGEPTRAGAPSDDSKRALRIPRGQPKLAAKGVFDYTIRDIDPKLAPERTWRRLMIKHLPYRSRHGGHQHPAGLEALREAIVNSISPLRGMSIPSENCILVSDEYRAIDIITRAVVTPNMRVAIEDPSDKGLRYLLEQQSSSIVPIPVDKYGLDVEQLRLSNVKIVFVTPAHQRPTGVTLSPERREMLLEWASDVNGYIVELDTFSEFQYDGSPLPALMSLPSSDRVIYVNAISSWIGSGMQLCYIAVPDKLIKPILKIRLYVNPELAWIDQRVAADFISSSVFFDHLRRIRQQLKSRRNAILTAMEDHMAPQRIFGAHAGRHLVWQLPDGAPDAETVQQRAAAARIVIPTMHNGFLYSQNQTALLDPDKTMLLGYSTGSEVNLRTGIARLAEIILER